MAVPGRAYQQALRTPQFAAIALTYFACCAAHSGPIFHMVSNALTCGVPTLAATTVFSAAGLGGLAGRIGCGLLADRVGAKQVLVVGLAAQALAILLYTFARDLASLYALSALFGIAYGGVMPLYAILVRQYFGARIMGATFGAATMASTLGMAIGPLAGGWIFDEFASYHWLYAGSFAIGLGAVALALTFRSPRVAFVHAERGGVAPLRLDALLPERRHISCAGAPETPSEFRRKHGRGTKAVRVWNGRRPAVRRPESPRASTPSLPGE